MNTGFWLAAGAAAAMYAGQAAAQSEGGSDQVLRTFADCRKVDQVEARLACFEKAAEVLEAAVRSKDIQIVNRADVRKARRSLFGFTLPRIDLFGGDGDVDMFTEINSTVASARPVANNRVSIRLTDSNDAVWETTDPVNFPPKAGTKIRIRQGALGNYFLSFGGVSFRGRRVH